MKNSFVFYTEWIEQIRLLEKHGTQKDLDAFWDALRAFVEDGDADPETAMAEMTFVPLRNQISRDAAKYEEISEKRRQARTKDNKQEQTITNHNKQKQIHTNATEDEDVDEDDDVDVSTNVDIMEGSEPILTFPLAKGKTFAVTQEIFDMLAECYPNVDTMEQLRKLKAWAISNPKRRKVDGMKFLNNWFSFEQDKGPPVQRKTIRQMTAEEILAIPAINPWSEEVST